MRYIAAVLAATLLPGCYMNARLDNPAMMVQRMSLEVEGVDLSQMGLYLAPNVVPALHPLPLAEVPSAPYAQPEPEGDVSLGSLEYRMPTALPPAIKRPDPAVVANLRRLAERGDRNALFLLNRLEGKQ